jgi:hypothetical protein
MRKLAVLVVAAAALGALFVALASRGGALRRHRCRVTGKPLISEDPSADNTDYAFRARTSRTP